MSWFPYSKFLLELLEKKYLKVEFDCQQFGVSGELTSRMKKRLPQILKSNKKANLVVIMGGTNDLGYGKSLQHIIANLQEMWETTLSSSESTVCIACLIPTNFFDLQDKTYEGKKAKVNDKITELCDAEGKRLFWLDVGDFLKMSDEERKRYWDLDKLHYTKSGYTMISQKVFEKIVSLKLVKDCEEKK